jgi:hypothetical protein
VVRVSTPPVVTAPPVASPEVPGVVETPPAGDQTPPAPVPSAPQPRATKRPQGRRERAPAVPRPRAKGTTPDGALYLPGPGDPPLRLVLPARSSIVIRLVARDDRPHTVRVAGRAPERLPAGRPLQVPVIDLEPGEHRIVVDGRPAGVVTLR